MSVVWAVFGLGIVALASLLAAILLPLKRAGDLPQTAASAVQRGPVTELRRIGARPRPMLRPTGLDRLLSEARIGWSARTFLLVLLALMLGFGVLTFALLRQPVLAGLVGGSLAALVLWFYLSRQRQAYVQGFAQQFLPALDIIVRGMRSGMPLIAALDVVKREVAGPVQIEFQRLLDDMSIGLSLPHSVERLAERVPLTEVQFFSIVIGVQSRTGGRLSEALENLAGTLRDRKHLELRIRTVSQEARTSAAIIAALPIFVTAGLFLFNPAYISVLFTQPTGLAVFGFCLLWMVIGSLVMKKMTEIHV